MCSPRGLGSTLCVPRKSQAAQAPNKVCAVDCADLFTSGFQTTAAAFCLLPRALSLALAVASGLCFPVWDDKLQLCLVPPLALVLLRALVTTSRHIVTICESVELECPSGSDLLPFRAAQPSLDSLSCVILTSSEYLYGSQPQSSPCHLIPRA